MKLQPIETAPQDGTWILILGGYPSSEQWYGSEWPPAVVAKYVCNKYSLGWYYADWDGDLRSEYIGPTHWMPLPEIKEKSA